MNFVFCWDESSTETDLSARSQACASEAGLDWAALSSCQAGSQVVELQKAAAIKFETKWPQHAHAGMYHVPHVLIEGTEVPITTGVYYALLQAVCDTGISAAACDDIQTPHYMVPPCREDETAILLGDGHFTACAKPCTDDASCPSDVPPATGTIIKPKCALAGSSDQGYCALSCTFTLACGTGTKCVDSGSEDGKFCAWPFSSLVSV